MGKGKIYTILLIAGALILVGILALIPEEHKHNWNIDEAPTKNGGSPYDLTLFDSLLSKSAANHYSIKTFERKITIKEDDPELIDEIAYADTDTALILIQNHLWEMIKLYDNGHKYYTDIEPLESMIEFARRGGKCLYVIQRRDATGSIYRLFHILPIKGEININFNDYDYNSKHKEYSAEWLQEPRGFSSTLVNSGKELSVDPRLAFNYIEYEVVTIVDVQNDEEQAHADEPEINSILTDKTTPTRVYAFDLYFPESGGRLIFTTLGLYFCNLGVTTNEGPEIISELVSLIDDKPIVRIDRPRGSGSNRNSKKVAIMDKIEANEALSLTWTLILALSFLVLVSGLMRRQQAIKGAEAIDVDKTDAMAVRTYQLRKSPLLHFLFQWSWLYNGKSNYRDLLDINYRRLARYLNRKLKIELSTADSDTLQKAAATLAIQQNRKASDIYAELIWMQSFALNTEDNVSAKQYKYSQTIVDNYL